jgi:hypothetical protein
MVRWPPLTLYTIYYYLSTYYSILHLHYLSNGTLTLPHAYISYNLILLSLSLSLRLLFYIPDGTLTSPHAIYAILLSPWLTSVLIFALPLACQLWPLAHPALHRACVIALLVPRSFSWFLFPLAPYSAACYLAAACRVTTFPRTFSAVPRTLCLYLSLSLLPSVLYITYMMVRWPPLTLYTLYYYFSDGTLTCPHAP